ncbi:MAG: hypothetical protein KAH25_00500 [Bacteroidales bacterium]|nr:hypothetical protein [Bacteroidales bacterium]
MKKILIASLLIFTFSLLKSQEAPKKPNYYEEMDRLIPLLDQAKSANTYYDLANSFKSLAQDEKTKWVPFYHASYAFIRAYLLDSQSDECSLTEAQILLDIAMKLSKTNDELTVLQGYIYQAHIKGKTGKAAFEWGKKAVMEYDHARFINDKNPRTYFLIGDVLYHLDKGFGGNRENACNHFIQAEEKFNSFVPRSSFSPNWGEEKNKNMLSKCK